MQERQEFVSEARSRLRVSEKAAEGLWDLGIRSVEELRGRDAVALYEELRNKPGCYCEPCMLNQFKVAVKLSEVK